MVITCPNCEAKYSIDQAALKGKGARATCKSCKTVFPIYTKEAEEAIAEEAIAEEPQEALPSAEELDVYSLDFKDVGLKSWKLRIKMGLTYDFSDYKTLSKYIRDGKVDMSDKLSSDDGNTWIPLNEIPNLEKHFCDVYLQKKKEMQDGIVTPSASKASKKSTAPEPMLGSGLSDLASVLAEAEAEVDGKPPPRNRPKAAPPPRSSSTNKTKPKASNSAPAQEEKKGNNTVLLLVLLLVVAGGGFVFMNGQETAGTKSVAAKESVQVKEEDREALNKSIEEQMEKVRRERQAAEEERLKNEPKTVVKTEEQLEAERLLRLQQQEKKEQEQKPQNKSVADLEKEGDQAIRTGNWAVAEKIYQEIVSQKPLAKYQVLLGRALYQQKKYAPARSILKTASKGDVQGYKWLGYIALAEGDDAGANEHFGLYLKSNPSDAAIIRKEMNGE